MPLLPQHPILQQSFALIDDEIGDHAFSPEHYAILRRIVHSTADFEFLQLLQISPDAVDRAIAALSSHCPIVVDVGMVRQGIQTMVTRTFNNPLITAIERVAAAEPGKTLTETGLNHAWSDYPNAIYVVGNAPTALSGLCDQMAQSDVYPPLVVGVPVGFVGVLDAKQRLAQLPVSQIRVDGRKGGSPVAAAIVNALLVMAWESQP